MTTMNIPAGLGNLAESCLNVAALPPFLRVLLTTDGTVTKSLEAYFWESIEVINRKQGYEKLAEDERLFSYLSAARGRGVDVDVVLGDARLTLGEVPANSLDLLVIDAFSSDAIPVHLLTVQALEVYWAAVAEGGVIAMHVSNRYLDLVPVLANLAEHMGSVCLVQKYSHDSPEQSEHTARAGSTWVVLSREMDDVRPLAATADRARWMMPTSNPGDAVWTDEYANVLGALQW